MNVFTGWTGWAIFIVLIVCGWLLLGAALAAAWHLTKRAYLRSLGIRAGAPGVHHLHAEAERLHGGDLSHCPSCLIGRDHRYLPVVIPCADHKPAGKHHAQAPVYGPEPVVAQPDYDEWVDEWNRRYSQ